MNYFTNESRRGTRTMHHRHFHYSEHDRGGPHHGRRGGGGRHRAKRGAVAASILTLLSERPMNGYELITELETRSEGRWRPSPGAIYPALRKLEDRGSITSTEVGGKLQFELTDRGRTMLAYYVEEQGDDRRSTVERGPVVRSLGRHARPAVRDGGAGPTSPSCRHHRADRTGQGDHRRRDHQARRTHRPRRSVAGI